MAQYNRWTLTGMADGLYAKSWLLCFGYAAAFGFGYEVLRRTWMEILQILQFMSLHAFTVKPTQDVWGVLAVIGFFVGLGKGHKYRVQAQQVLCQVTIEQRLTELAEYARREEARWATQQTTVHPTPPPFPTTR